jgi:hypothetical protein
MVEPQRGTADLAIFCKTYRGDLDRFCQLAHSVALHNGEGLPFLVSTPERDAELFRSALPAHQIVWTTDEALLAGTMDDGWTQQQIVKFHVARAGVAKNYLMVDSDFYFIAPIEKRQFVDADGVPFLVLREGTRARFFEAIYGGGQHAPATISPATKFVDESQWRKLDPWDTGHGIRRIQCLFGRSGPSYSFMPGPVWNAAVLEQMERELLEPLRMTFHDLIAISPWEYQWYGEWVLARRPHPIYPIEPCFFGFVADNEIERARAIGISEAFIARYFVGIHLASNHQTILRVDDAAA